MTTQELLTDAAIEWWKGRRPVGWTEVQHLVNPQINTSTYSEKSLCLAVATYIKKRDAK